MFIIWLGQTTKQATTYHLCHNELFCYVLTILFLFVPYLSLFFVLFFSLPNHPPELFIAKSRALFISHTYAHRWDPVRQTCVRARSHKHIQFVSIFILSFCSFLCRFQHLPMNFVAICRVFYCIFGRQTRIHCLFNVTSLERIKRCAVVWMNGQEQQKRKSSWRWFYFEMNKTKEYRKTHVSTEHNTTHTNTHITDCQ